MSADEIRRLAEPLCRDRAVSVYNTSLDEFVADGCVTLKYRDALLAYAAMVERCEESLKCNFVARDGRTSIDSAVKAQVNYILKGAINV